MSIPLVVANATYNFPESRESPGWGAAVTDWAQAVTDVLNNVQGSGDIAQTAATINNDQSSTANIVGLLFDTSVVRGAVIDYAVYRVTDSSEVCEVGTMYISYRSVAAAWDLVVVGGNNANVTFSISSLGQVTYTTDNMSGSSYSGVIHFRARALLQ